MKQTVEKCIQETNDNLARINEVRASLGRIKAAYAKLTKYIEENYDISETQKVNVIKPKSGR